MTLRFATVCSGIEAASTAWKPLGWQPVFFSEIDKFPCAVLAHHYPDVPNYGDMTKFKDWPDATLDVLAGGTPCQSFSNAGLRAGLDDPRGQLMLTFGAIAAKYRPRWLVWENVPGVLSSNGGRDFGAFLGLLGFLGYGFAYRVLDAQYVRVDGYPRAVPQRRNRVFVVGCLGDWRSAAAVLLERESLRGDPAPRREARKVAPTIPSRSTAGGGLGTDFDCDGGIICVAKGQGGSEIGADMAPTLNCNHEAPYVAHCRDIAQTITSNYGKQVDNSDTGLGPNVVAFDTTQITSAANYSNPKVGDPCHPLAAGMHAPAIAFPGRMSATQCASSEELSPALCAINPTAVAFNMHKSGNDASSLGISEDRTDCLRAFEKSPFAVQPRAGTMVRRLTPEECEKLQGFLPGHTLIPWRKKPASECPDGPRYKSLGNSWAVPVARWIGERIALVDSIHSQRQTQATQNAESHTQLFPTNGEHARAPLGS